MTDLPKWKCHKVVEAAKIAHIIPLVDEAGVILQFEGTLTSVKVNLEYMLKAQPRVGGYYVEYKDGYNSYSPAEVFEEGYTRIYE